MRDEFWQMSTLPNPLHWRAGPGTSSDEESEEIVLEAI